MPKAMHDDPTRIRIDVPKCKRFKFCHKTSLNQSFMTLNVINFADKARRENDKISWNVR